MVLFGPSMSEIEHHFKMQDFHQNLGNSKYFMYGCQMMGIEKERDEKYENAMDMYNKLTPIKKFFTRKPRR